ncbi:hypothetical protein WR25_26334 [Diploscapter pachys]|uniref:ShKT domain-containing protein n=1 Tax=Diploscapter pachys TaxID=2018661 RepID=A0A2A2L6D7_9BILA|nr:hypothetical protein WR25_26334 [Diploscapter pachys]
MLSTILLPLVTIAGRIQDDFNCTYVVTSGALAGNVVYSPLATSCTDTLPAESCEVLFKGSSEGPVVPDSIDSSRPVNCYSFQNGPIIENQKKMSIMSCPSYCGYCCQTKAFQCANPNPDNLDCHSITPQACMDPEQKPMLAKNCPAKCGLCDYHPEGVEPTDGPAPNPNSSNENKGNGSGEKKNCKYAPDKAKDCKVWHSRGFCQNSHYTTEYKKKYCSTTCKICI